MIRAVELFVISQARRAKACEQGAAALEFKLIMPIFLAISGGLLEFGYDSYLRAQLGGIVSDAARDITLESSADQTAQSALNASVSAAVRLIEPNAQLRFKIESFRRYASARDPAEPFVDANENGRCDKGESYEDLNGDRDYSANSAISGLGAADDVLVYTVTVSYNRLFGFMQAMGLARRADYTVTRMLKIQPYSSTRPILVRTCI
ncbi:MAG: TadE/TadG family type IV pilus assembly protein [Sphingomonadaceae bacterium]|jgi:hypothetical protein